jgi:hypothetical protein
LLLQNPGSLDSDWSATPNIFSRLHNSGQNISILGFYHPYCSIFIFANPCFSRPVFAYSSWWWGIWQGLRSIPGVDILARKYQWTNDGFNESTTLQLRALNQYLSNNSVTLTFIHLNIPHLPGGRINDIDFKGEMKAMPGYDQNLLAVDWVVGKIVKSLEVQSHSQDILLIVSSDHWLRTKYNSENLSSDQIKREFGSDTDEVHKIPLLIRRMRETSSYEISTPINSVYTAQLIEDFLGDKVSGHFSLAKWWLNKPYINPMIQ